MRRFIIACVFGAVACAGSPSSDVGESGQNATAAGLKLDAPPANGLQIVLPVVPHVPPSSSQEHCSWTEHVLDADIDVKATRAFQTKTGHHIVLFYTMNKEPPGTTRICTDADMATFRFASAAGGEGGTDAPLPGDLVVHIPKGAQLVLNHHYLNAGLSPVDAQSAMDVIFADPGAKTTRSSALAVLDTKTLGNPGAHFCTKQCDQGQDSECGQGAGCACQSGQCGCVPNSCK